MVKVIRSFPKSSAEGPDGLRPQRFKDMLSERGSQDILPALTSFVHLVLEGRTPATIRPFFFGTNLIKGIRPIAVSCTLHCLVAKIAGNKVMKEMGILLAPWQLGFGVKGGEEAAVHAVRLYLQDPDLGKAVLKLNIRNIFNTIHRDWMLNAVSEHAPTLHPFVHSAYSSPSSLF